MDTGRNRDDTRNSVLLVAAAVGVAAGLALVTYPTLAYPLSVTLVGAGIAAASALSVFVRRRWVGGLVVALALTAAFLLLFGDFFTIPGLVAAVLAAVAGMAILAVAPRIPRS